MGEIAFTHYSSTNPGRTASFVSLVLTDRSEHGCEEPMGHHDFFSSAGGDSLLLSGRLWLRT